MNQTMSQREQACILPSLALILYILHSLFIMLATFPALVSPCPTGSVYQFAHFFFPFLSFFFIGETVWKQILQNQCQVQGYSSVNLKKKLKLTL